MEVENGPLEDDFRGCHFHVNVFVRVYFGWIPCGFGWIPFGVNCSTIEVALAWSEIGCEPPADIQASLLQCHWAWEL